MNKRKVKKKFKLTNKEFRVMTFNDPNIFKNISTILHSFYANSYLPYRLYFVKGRRVTKEEYYNYLDKLEKEVC